MIAVALGAAVGVILVPVNFVLAALTTVFPVLPTLSLGLWGMATLMPLAVLRRGGVGIVGAAAAGFVLIVSPGALLMVVVMALWGSLVELPFFLTRYRYFGWKMFAFAGLIPGLVSALISMHTHNLLSMNPGFAIFVSSIGMASSIIGSLLSLGIAHSLARAGISGGHRRDGA